MAGLYLPGARLVDGDGVHEGPDAIAAALGDGDARPPGGNASAQHDAPAADGATTGEPRAWTSRSATVRA
ncbi:hypothetical protein [Streptomyces sp. NPDC001770]